MATGSKGAAKPVQLCVVRVHHLDLLLPMNDGMKLVALLQQAARVDRDWVDHGQVYTVRAEEQLDVELALVRASQVRMPQGEVRRASTPRGVGKQLLLG